MSKLSRSYLRVAANLGLRAKELSEPSDTLFDILSVAAPSVVVLPIHEEVVKLIKVLWQIPSSLPSRPPYLQVGREEILCPS